MCSSHDKDSYETADLKLLKSLKTFQIKRICPTAPTQGPDDWEGLDASAAHIANLLSTKPADVIVGIGGFSMGATIALYSATCYAMGRYGNGNPYPVNLRVVVGLSGWLPGSIGFSSSWTEGAFRHIKTETFFKTCFLS
ncbi:hypothetical protein UlMin_024208 [Ulmus minor]